MRKALEQCPACHGPLQITRLSCASCDTEVTGRFAATAFDRLSPDSLAFAEAFVRSRGNVKEMERELGVPYAAVRNRLDEVIRELGHPGAQSARPGRPAPPAPKAAPAIPAAPAVPASPAPAAPGGAGASRRQVLERLERGEIDAETAVRQLQRTKETPDE